MLLDEADEIQEFLVEAEKASFQAKGLTKQLLTFARGGTPIRQTTNIVELIRDTAIFALSGTNIRCEFDLQPHLWQVDIDKSQMSQVINNIVINGIQAMPDGGLISIKAENMRVDEVDITPLAKGDYIKLAIRDQGIGISEEQQKNIFDPYFTTREDGSGLGWRSLIPLSPSTRDILTWTPNPARAQYSTFICRPLWSVTSARIMKCRRWKKPALHNRKGLFC